MNVKIKCIKKVIQNVSCKFYINLFIALIMKFWTSFYKYCSQILQINSWQNNGDKLYEKSLINFVIKNKKLC